MMDRKHKRKLAHAIGLPGLGNGISEKDAHRVEAAAGAACEFTDLMLRKVLRLANGEMSKGYGTMRSFRRAIDKVREEVAK